jgi:transposase InsO family protein
MLRAFIFEEILCYWGTVKEIITDNGTAYIATLDWLASRYGINHIHISTYNSQVNSIIERQHYTIHKSLVKTYEGNVSLWPVIVPHIFWADWATIQKSTGYSPYYMAHSIKPLLPFDITLATFLIPNMATPLSTAELIAICTHQLQKHEDNLAHIKDNVLAAYLTSVRQFERQFKNTIQTISFKPGDLVLVRNSAVEMDLGHKMKPCYFRPMCQEFLQNFLDHLCLFLITVR